MYHYGWDAGSSWLMLLWMLLFWGGLLTIGIFLVRTLLSTITSTSPSNSRQVTPLQTAINIAQERYANGEITREQYLQIIQDMKDV